MFAKENSGGRTAILKFIQSYNLSRLDCHKFHIQWNVFLQTLHSSVMIMHHIRLLKNHSSIDILEVNSD